MGILKKKMGRPPLRPGEKKVVMGFTLTQGLADTIRASADDRGMSHLVEQILREAFNLQEYSQGLSTDDVSRAIELSKKG